MTRSQPSESDSRDEGRQRRWGAMLAGFVIGLPLAAGILYTFQSDTFQGTLAQRYVSHPIEKVEIVLFGCALGVFCAKLLGLLIERAGLRRQLLPPWNGEPGPVAEARRLQAELARQPGWARSTWIGRRITAILEFLSLRRSANDLDDQLRTLADNDAVALESSYALTRFISWAIPILGFLGTVLGITEAIAGVTPQELEHNINRVTDGLALAFDTTGLALALTMIVMFFSFIVEKLEQRMLEAVDRAAEQQLAHRFERTGSEGGEVLELLRQQGQALIEATEGLVEKQAAVWAKSLEEAQRRRAELEADFRKQLSAALESALELSLEAHTRRLAELQRQAVEPAGMLVEKLGGLAEAAGGLAKQTEALRQLQEGEQQLVRLQQVLAQNLAALADAGSFQQAVHSLTAAIHLLTASSTSARRPGVAA
jgi:hypothetical protein